MIVRTVADDVAFNAQYCVREGNCIQRPVTIGTDLDHGTFHLPTPIGPWNQLHRVYLRIGKRTRLRPLLSSMEPAVADALRFGCLGRSNESPACRPAAGAFRACRGFLPPECPSRPFPIASLALSLCPDPRPLPECRCRRQQCESWQ